MAKFDAYGTVFQIDNAGYVTVAQVRSVSGPSMSLDTVDVTTHDSSAGWREFVATLIDAGEISLELVWDPDLATHIQLRTDLTARTDSRLFKVIFPDATSTEWIIPGIVTSYEPNAPVDGELSATITIKADGAPTLA